MPPKNLVPAFTAKKTPLVWTPPKDCNPVKYPKLRNDQTNIKFDPATGCWEWVGKDTPKEPKDYVYELLMDDLPKGQGVFPACNTTTCVCPFHMKVQDSRRGDLEFQQWLQNESLFLKGANKEKTHRNPPKERTPTSHPTKNFGPTKKEAGVYVESDLPPIVELPKPVLPKVTSAKVKVQPPKVVHAVIVAPPPPPPVNLIPKCGKGHILSPDNLYTYGSGKECLTCRKLRQSARNEQRRSQRGITSAP